MSSLNFNTANQTMRQLLGNGLTYQVPPFQRDYAWTEDEWDDLWQDIGGLFEPDGETAHYMGYLVLQSADAKRFAIIDGQQRITTLSLLVLAALGHLKDLVAAAQDGEKNQRRFESLRGSYIGFVDPVSLASRPKLVLNRHNDRFYQTYLTALDHLPQRGLNASEHQLRKAFGWFKERLKARVGSGADSGERLAAFIDTLVDKVFFTVITVTDELNAFKVFETLNARGVRLSAPDLLKNHLFSMLGAGETHAIELNALEDRWERIVGVLENETFSEFLRVYWNSRHKLVRKADLFKTIRHSVTTRAGAFELLRDLDRHADAYAALRDPEADGWNLEEREALRHLNMFSVRQPMAMLLACHERFFEPDRAAFTRVVRAVSIMAFRYNVICNLLTHDQERVYNEVARNVSGGAYRSAREVLQALREVYPADRQFKAAFSEKELRTTNSRNAKVARYILQMLEKQASGQALDFASQKYTLEHVLPEHPGEAWRHIEEPRQAALIYRLGNLTLLEASANRHLGNDGYAAKQAVYAQSAVHLTRAIAADEDEWDEERIAARQARMAELATGVWRLD